jgi:hypothetical protein
MTVRTKNAIANAQKFFHSGKQYAEKYRDGNSSHFRLCATPLHSIDSEMVAFIFALATVVLCKPATGGGEQMIRDIYFSHYRAIRGVVTTVVALGAAVLVSYFILSLGV